MNSHIVPSEKIAKLKSIDIDLMIATCGDNTFLRNKLLTLKKLITEL